MINSSVNEPSDLFVCQYSTSGVAYVCRTVYTKESLLYVHGMMMDFLVISPLDIFFVTTGATKSVSQINGCHFGHGLYVEFNSGSDRWSSSGVKHSWCL